MKYTQLGRAGLRVSRLCLGTMNFGPRTPKEDAFRILDRAFESGINFIDTADRYGNPHGSGETERILGEWMEVRGVRDQIVVATKCFGPMGPGPNDQGLSAYHIRHACEASLERLRTDRIDLYQLHHIDRGMPHFKGKNEFLRGDLSNLEYPKHLKPGAQWDEIYQAIDTLIGQGKVIYLGTCNFPGWSIVQGIERAGRRAGIGVVSEQTKYNLLSRLPELEVVPVCREYGVGLLPYSPLSRGALAGSVDDPNAGRRKELNLDEETRGRISRFEAIAGEHGWEPAALATAWILHNPVVTAPIVGPRTLEQLESAIGALNIEIDESTLQELDVLFPGPGYPNRKLLAIDVYDKLEESIPGGRNEAPEAYAW